VGKKTSHQVVWANQGIDLLNSSNVTIELHRYDAATGNLRPISTSRSPDEHLPGAGPRCTGRQPWASRGSAASGGQEGAARTHRYV
jgi:hypothetical protein